MTIHEHIEVAANGSAVAHSINASGAPVAQRNCAGDCARVATCEAGTATSEDEMAIVANGAEKNRQRHSQKRRSLRKHILAKVGKMKNRQKTFYSI